MTPETILVLAILVGSIILFAWERFGPDLVAMLVLISLALTGLVSNDDIFSGFASPAVVTVWAIYIISDGLFKTGIADYLGTHMLKVAGANEIRLTAVIMLTVGVMSAFMNNIGATAVLLPAIIGISRQTNISSSKFLIPLAFASLMGGNMTLIGTPPNILASGILHDMHPELAFSFFDFLPMGVIVLGGGIIYMVLIGRHLLPATKLEGELTRNYNLRDYATELKVLPDSPLVGKTIVESRFGENYDLTIISRLNRTTMVRLPAHVSNTRRLTGNTQPVQRTETINANDVFLVQGKLEQILKIKEEEGLKLGPDIKLSDVDLLGGESTIAEVVVTPTCELIGQTLKEARFREQYNLSVMALWRSGQPTHQELANITIQPGDVLLLQGPEQNFKFVGRDPGLLVLKPVEYESRRTKKAPVSLFIMAGMLLVVTMGWLHISVAAVIAAMLMVILRVMTMDEAYRAIQWRSIFLIAGMLPIGIAMENTGTARLLADQIVAVTGSWGALGVLVGIYIMTLFITQPMSNAAATVLVAPIAIDAANSLGADPRPFLMAVVIAASTAFLTPIGHQSNVLVYGVGGYKFTDFTKVGAGLNVFYLILVVLILPLIWPLFP